MSKTPNAPKKPLEITQHQHKRVDNYAWLRDQNWKDFIKGDLNFHDKDVQTYLEHENAYTEEYMASFKGLQKEFYDEILSRVKEDDETYPIPKGDYLYYSRTIKGQNYPIFCRKKNDSAKAPGQEEIYFDTNKEAEKFELYQLKGRKTNNANTCLLYGFNTTGSLEATLKLRNLNDLSEETWQIENCNGGFLWTSDEEFLYIERDEFSRGKQIYKVNKNEGPSTKKLVFTKPAKYENMFMSIELTSDEKFVIIQMQSGGTSACYTMDLKNDEIDFFIEAENDVSHDVDHWEEHFYILHNENDADHFQMDRTHQKKRTREEWETIIPESNSRYITSYSITNHKLIYEAKNTELALDQLFIFDIHSKKTQQVHFNDEVYTVSVFGAYDPFSETIRVFYESPVAPEQDIDLHLETLQLEVLHTEEVPNFDASLYTVKREFARAHDNELIPLTIITRNDFQKNGEAPAFIYGYGSYGFAYPPQFNSAVFSLADRGFSVTLAHIRGGDDKGHSWYLQGKMRNKKNTFFDFISSCEHLIENKYTKKGQIAATGGSAGGLLMGAVVNMRPDLFKAVIADVAFVDMINTISDETLPLTAPEWEEWGNPILNKEDFDYMMSYSPYDNVSAQDYPAMLFNSGISDEQVTYWEPTKMVAKLREMKTDKNILLLKVKMNAGHAGASKRYEWIEDKAFNYAFFLSQFR